MLDLQPSKTLVRPLHPSSWRIELERVAGFSEEEGMNGIAALAQLELFVLFLGRGVNWKIAR